MLQSPDRKPRSRATSLLNQTITKSELSENLQSYLDPLGEVGVEVVAVHDAVLNRVRAIDGELEGGLLASDLAKTLALESLLAGLVGLLSGHAALLGGAAFLGRSLNWGLHASHDHRCSAVCTNSENAETCCTVAEIGIVLRLKNEVKISFSIKDLAPKDSLLGQSLHSRLEPRRDRPFYQHRSFLK